MRRLLLVLMLGSGLSIWAQDSSKPDGSAPPKRPAPANQAAPNAAPAAAKPDQQPSAPNPAPPQQDSINASTLDDEPGESSSKDAEIDLSPPADDAQTHPKSAEAVLDAEDPAHSGDVSEFHPWDPHKAAKDVEVGDFYFKQKNYVGAESRYREALYYKDDDAIATFRLAVCLEKMGQPDEALEEYQNYLKILPYGPEAQEAKKAIERLKHSAAKAKPAK